MRAVLVVTGLLLLAAIVPTAFEAVENRMSPGAAAITAVILVGLAAAIFVLADVVKDVEKLKAKAKEHRSP